METRLNKSTMPLPLIDKFGRKHTSLRISVTDKCNLRCQYCMPDTPIKFQAASNLLTFEEITQVVNVIAARGVQKIRITGGEPLLRRELYRLVSMVSSIKGLEDIALTTNGILLEEQIEKLVKAGLKRVNISLDTLQTSTFRTVSRRDGLDRVLRGIAAAQCYSELALKLNALILRDVNFEDVLELAHFATDRRIPLRFIEFMPLDADRAWSTDRMVSGAEMRQRIEKEFGPLIPVNETPLSRPSADFVAKNGQNFGFINTVTQPFCRLCDRLRLTADGKIRNCLFGVEEWDVRHVLRSGLSPGADLNALFDSCVEAKHFAHGSPHSVLQAPPQAMYQIGG